MSPRLDQLLGVVSLAAIDRLRDVLATSRPGAGLGSDPRPVGEVEAAALVHLQAWAGTSVNELAGVVGRSQPATARLVDRLVERRLVLREEGIDRRTVALRLTDRGEALANETLAARARALAPMLEALTAAERAGLEALLGRLAGQLADDRAGATHACRLCDRGACMSGPGCPMGHTLAPDAPGPNLTDRQRP